MLFQRKYDKAMELLKEKNEAYEDEERKNDNLEKEEVGLDKTDRFAMTISAFLVFIPVAIVVLGIFALIAILFGML